MQFTDRKTLPYGPYELYGPKAKFTDRYSAGILDNPQAFTVRTVRTDRKVVNGSSRRVYSP